MVALSALDVLLGVGLAAAGFIVVALVCAAVLAVLQVVLPSTDSGADEVDRLHPVEEDREARAEPGEGSSAAAGLDNEVNA